MRGLNPLVVTSLLLLPGPLARAGSDEDATAKTAHPRHTLDNTELRTLPRAASGRDYLLYIALPPGYGSEPERKYPALYLCDGYWDFTLVNGFYGNLRYDRVIPEFVIVGLGYAGENPDYDALRRYDYTPVPDPDGDPEGRHSGHAPEFLGVLSDEIIPFVEREYRVDPSYRVLGGSSLGGLFALYALLERPGLFQAYIAPSPAVDWANDWLFDLEGEVAARGTPLPARLYMTGAGEESPPFLAAIQRFNARLEAHEHPGLVYQWRLIDGERHSGTKAEGYNRGVRFAFAPLAPGD